MTKERQSLSLPSAISIVISSMVGVGVFTSVGFQLAAVPSAFPILLLWLLGGVIALCGALCYAELVAMWPRSGGEYHLLREAYHPAPGFLAGWVSLTAGFAAPLAALGIAFGVYAHDLGVPLPPGALAAGIVLVVAALHLGPLKLVGGFLTAATTLKVALILAFLAGAWLLPGGERMSLAPRAGDGALLLGAPFAVSMVYVLFSYSGWNGAAYVASELREPQRLVPRALLWGTGIVTVLYVALNAAFLWRAPWDRMSGQVEAALIAGEASFGPRGGWALGAMIAVGLLSTIASYTWAGSRVTDRMGQDYPRLGILARRNRWGAPHLALGLQTALALGLLASGKFDAVVNYLMALLQLSSLLVVVAVLVWRRRAPDLPRPFRVPLYPVPPLVFIVATAWVLVFQIRERPVESAAGALTLLAGLALYAGVRPKSAASLTRK
ncbi:MAG TPA: APC family permease [Kiritimatiellia bacterium]|nr:APC family permease [Kiritimatiellia bacterium]